MIELIMKNALCAFLLLLAMRESSAQVNPSTPSSADNATVVLSGEKIRVEAVTTAGKLSERYLARADGQWVEVASSEGQSVGPVGFRTSVETATPGTAQKVTVVGDTLTEEFEIGGNKIERKVTLTKDGPWVRVTTRLEPNGNQELHAFTDRFRFTQRPDWTFSSSVGGFDPDAQYKAPLILVQHENLGFGIVPDVTVLDRETLQLCHHALDLDVPAGPLLSVGFMPAQFIRHSVFAEQASKWTVQKPLENAYYLLLTAVAKPGEAYRDAVRFHWKNFGRPTQAHAAAQQRGTENPALELWDDYRTAVWEQMSTQQWLTVPLADGKVGGGVCTHRLFPNSVYLTSWFNTLRTSYGMALYARRVANDKLLQQAVQTETLALAAPGHDGAFKCIAGVDDQKNVSWAAGDGSGGSTREGFLAYDMSWTGYWLLKWRAAGLPGAEGVLPRCQALAGFLISHQQSNGMFPTFYNEDGSANQEKSSQVIAETGPVTLFLLQLYEQDKNPAYLAAAKKGLAFLDTDVIPVRKWYDFETFWSCSPRNISFDERTALWPANDLALGQSVAAYLQAWRDTNDKTYLDKGTSLLDYLLLYQQSWTNPFQENLSCPEMLLGGFTTQNSDAEWSDARQSQCGNILLDYYRATGEVEYLERGVAALRAQFPVSPAENWAHQGYGHKEGVSSFHWGYGSGMSGIEMESDFLRDAIVDIRASRCIGVNGLNVTACQVSIDQITLDLSSPFKWKQKPVVVFRGTEPGRHYAITVNGTTVGTFDKAALEKGIETVALKDP
jgi:hypothetical protein